jgi:hypothetical protein
VPPDAIGDDHEENAGAVGAGGRAVAGADRQVSTDAIAEDPDRDADGTGARGRAVADAMTSSSGGVPPSSGSVWEFDPTVRRPPAARLASVYCLP